MVHLDYVWVDGLEAPLVRSKTKIVKEFNGIAPLWNFDGSSTEQATTSDSERVLQPVRVYKLHDRKFIVLCEVMHPDGTPHPSNHRNSLTSVINAVGTDKGLWLGYEQEFFLTLNNKNILWNEDGSEPIQDTRYYCSSGGPIRYRDLISDFADTCNDMGIGVVGYNTEVSPGQWEYQVFGDDPIKAADDLWVSRYLLQLAAEEYGLGVDWHPKPHVGWNGSGMHTNFSTTKTRDVGGKELFDKIIENAGSLHVHHMEQFGPDNQMRMTGGFETSSYHKFSSGVASRATSFRIPSATARTWKGYAEDRRPSSNCDPYRVTKCVFEYVV